MKTVFTLWLLLNTAFNCQCQTLNIQWQHSFGSVGNDQATCILQTRDSGFVIAGYSDSVVGNTLKFHASSDYWIIKLDKSGTLQWQKSWGGLKEDVPKKIIETKTRQIVVVGSTESNEGEVFGRPLQSPGNKDGWVVVFSNTGQLLFLKALGGSKDDLLFSVTETKYGYAFAGAAKSNDGSLVNQHRSATSAADMWFVFENGPLTLQTSFTYGGSGDDYANDVVQTSDGGFILAGASNSIDGDVTGNHGGLDFWIVKLTYNGEIEWQRSFGGSADEAATSIYQNSDSSYTVGGWTHSNDGDVAGNRGSDDYWIIKVNSKGGLIWQKTLGGSGDDRLTDLHMTSDGGSIACGSTMSNDGNVTGHIGPTMSGDFWIVKLDSNGNLRWQKSLGSSGNDEANGIVQTFDGKYVVAGVVTRGDNNVTNYGGGSADYWVAKFGGPVDAGPVTNNSAITIYPNPASDWFYISSLIVGDFTITVTDVIGRIALTGKYNSNGHNPSKIDVNSCANGLYIVRLSGPEKFRSNQIIDCPLMSAQTLSILRSTLKLMMRIPEQDIEGGQRSVDTRNILLQIHFFFVRQYLMRIDLLLDQP